MEQIRTIDRNCEIPHEGPFCDLMWSDPEEIETWAVSPRGAGWLFGSRVTAEVYIEKLLLVSPLQSIMRFISHMPLDYCKIIIYKQPSASSAKVVLDLFEGKMR